MSTITYYPKSSTQAQGLAVAKPNTYDPNKKYMLWIIGHGIGERGDGSQTALSKVVNWASSSGEGWTNLRKGVDKYEFIAIFINTSHDYEYGEALFALEWAKTNLPIDTSRIFYLGHSLGSYGAGKYILLDDKFTSQLAGWIVSASGNFGDNTALWNELNKNDIRIVGITAANDTVSGTTPLAVTRIADRMTQIRANYPVTVIEYPAGIWTSSSAHNAVLAKITADSLNTTISISTRGATIPSSPKFKMNIYQWAQSNPKGSIAKLITDDPGAVFPQPDPMPTTKIIKRVGFNISDPDSTRNNQVIEIFWDSQSTERYDVKNVYYSDKSDRVDITLLDGSKKSFYKTKEVPA